MANMGYCRFRNTRTDLRECIETLQDREALSSEEFRACKRMFEEITDFLLEEGIIEDDGEFGNRLTDFFGSINVEE